MKKLNVVFFLTFCLAAILAADDTELFDTNYSNLLQNMTNLSQAMEQEVNESLDFHDLLMEEAIADGDFIAMLSMESEMRAESSSITRDYKKKMQDVLNQYEEWFNSANISEEQLQQALGKIQEYRTTLTFLTFAPFM